VSTYGVFQYKTAAVAVWLCQNYDHPSGKADIQPITGLPLKLLPAGVLFLFYAHLELRHPIHSANLLGADLSALAFHISLAICDGFYRRWLADSPAKQPQVP
jgi:hypothetical protein